MAHPAIIHGGGTWSAGWPLIITRGNGEVGCACPPCAQITVAPTCTSSGTT